MVSSMVARYILMGIALSIIIIILGILAIPSTDDFSPDNPLYNGLQSFVLKYSVTEIVVQDLNSIGPGSLVFIIGPDKGFTSEEIETIRSYLARGGAIFLADDYGSGRDILDRLGTGISFYRGVLRDPIFMYRNSYLPRVEIQFDGERYRLYMNYGTAINISRNADGECLGRSSAFSYLELLSEEPGNVKRLEGPLCIFYRLYIGGGILYVLSDPSVFINSMFDLGESKTFIEKPTSPYRPYIVIDKWQISSYTALRSNVVSMLSLLADSIYRYALLSIGIILTYILVIHKKYRGANNQGCRDAGDKVIQELVEKHPDWDKELLRKLLGRRCR